MTRISDDESSLGAVISAPLPRTQAHGRLLETTLTNTRRGTLYLLAWRQTVSDWAWTEAIQKTHPRRRVEGVLGRRLPGLDADESDAGA